MNWRIEAKADDLEQATPNIELAEHEKPKSRPKAKTVAAARAAAAKLASELGGETMVTIDGHETLDGDAFRPGHVLVVVSRVDPASG